MKFDLIISNPPYNKGLDLKILESILDLSDNICFVHPMGWLYDNKLKSYSKIRELVKNRFIHYEKIEGNELFGIRMFTDLAITVFAKSGGIGNEIYEIDIHGSSQLYRNLKKKILNFCKVSNMNSYIKHKNFDMYEVAVPMISGSSDQKALTNTTFVYLKSGKTTRYPLKFLFSTESEMKNFESFLKLKFTRFCLSIFKMNANLHRGELGSIPYFEYSKTWTDQECAKELGITDEELLWMIQQIPDYYPEDNEIYRKLEEKLLTTVKNCS